MIIGDRSFHRARGSEKYRRLVERLVFNKSKYTCVCVRITIRERGTASLLRRYAFAAV